MSNHAPKPNTRDEIHLHHDQVVMSIAEWILGLGLFTLFVVTALAAFWK